MNRDYELSRVNASPKNIDHSTGTGIAMSIAANRISYTFNFTGPSLAIDCACSSSLVALHIACQAIKQGLLPFMYYPSVKSMTQETFALKSIKLYFTSMRFYI